MSRTGATFVPASAIVSAGPNQPGLMMALPHDHSNRLMHIPAGFARYVTRHGEKSIGAIGNLYGAALVVLVMVLRTGASAVIHGLPRSIGSLQLLFLESVFALFFLCGFFCVRCQFSLMRSRVPGLQCAAALCNVVGTWFLFEALKRLPLAISSALSLVSLTITVLGSCVLFGEKPSRGIVRGLVFTAFGIVGLTYSLVQPAGAVFFPVAAACCFACASLVAKRIAVSDPLLTSVWWRFVWQVAFTALPTLFYWRPISFSSYAAVGATGLVVLISIPLTLQAESFAAMAFLAPFKCLRILCAAVWGSVFFGETLTLAELGGMACMVAAYYLLFKNRGSMRSYFLTARPPNA